MGAIKEIKVDVVIPSMGRADIVKTTNAISNCILCVPEKEADEYKKHNPGIPIEAHPDNVLGISMKRQWIIENHPNVFMVDDDIKAMNRMYVEPGETSKVDPDTAYWIIQFLANCAKMAGAFLFGVSKYGKPSHYNEYSPIKLSGIIEGNIGILEGSKLFFHEKATLSEDHWISAYNAFVHRYCWIDDRFTILGETYSKQGGLASIRNKDDEMKNTIWLREMFGESVNVKSDTVDAKRKHEFQRTISIPF